MQNMELDEEMSCRLTPLLTFVYGQKGNKNASKSINDDKKSKLHSCSHDYLRDFLFRFLSVNIPQLWSFRIASCGGS